MRLVSEIDNRKLYCGRLKGRPGYTHWRGCYVNGLIDGQDTEFWINDQNSSKIVSFKIGKDWFYFSDQSLANSVNFAEDHLFKFTAVDAQPLITIKVDRKEKLGHLFTGYTDALIGDSKVAPTEHNDCTVKALMEVKGIKYDEAWTELRQHRKPRRKIPFATVLRTYYSKSFKEVRLDKMTLGTFAEEHQEGRYIVLISGHALAVIDGKIKDSAFRPGSKVKNTFLYLKEVV